MKRLSMILMATMLSSQFAYANCAVSTTMALDEADVQRQAWLISAFDTKGYTLSLVNPVDASFKLFVARTGDMNFGPEGCVTSGYHAYFTDSSERIIAQAAESAKPLDEWRAINKLSFRVFKRTIRKLLQSTPDCK